MASARFTLNKEDALHILKVAGYLCASSLLAAAIAILNKTTVPTMWLWLVPSVNLALVTLKKLVDDHSTE